MSLSELWQTVVNYPINWVMVFQVIGVYVLVSLVLGVVWMLWWGLEELVIMCTKNFWKPGRGGSATEVGSRRGRNGEEMKT